MSIFTPEEMCFLQTQRVGRLATCGPSPDPRPHCVPVCYAYAQERIWIAIDEKPKSGRPLRRLRNIAANPEVALTIDHYEDDWSRLAYLIVEGHAAELSLSAPARAALESRYPPYRRMSLRRAIAITPARAIFWKASP